MRYAMVTSEGLGETSKASSVFGILSSDFHLTVELSHLRVAGVPVMGGWRHTVPRSNPAITTRLWVSFCIVWYCMIWYGWVMYGIARFGMVLYGLVWYACVALGPCNYPPAYTRRG